MSRKFIYKILLIFFFSPFIPSVSFAEVAGGPPGIYSVMVSGTPAFTWEVRDGYAYILTNSITINMQPGNNTGRPCPAGCSIAFLGDKFSDSKQFFSEVTLNEIRSYIGKTGALSSYLSGTSLLCVTFTDHSNLISGVPLAQVFPATCLSGGGGLPPINIPPDPTLFCIINGGVIQHGEVSLAALSGHRADTDLSIICNGRVSVKLTSSGYNKSGLVLQGSAGSLNTLIKVQGVPLENGVAMTVNDVANVNVSSELLSPGNVIPSGFYSGSVILVVTVD